jgi:hypothetical protein
MTSLPNPAQLSACTLSPDRFRDRKALIGAIFERGFVQVAPLADGVRASFVAAPEIEADLRALVSLEAECCSSLSMSVRASDSEVVLDVTGPPETQALIENLFNDATDPSG